MRFQRARSDEQKEIRRKQIMKAAAELFKKYEYKDITLNMIAGKLDFSRANMSRYVATKEEIFLLLYVEDMILLTEELQKSYTKKMNYNEFADFLVSISMSHTNFMRIGCILSTIIENNISVEKLVGYKKIMFEQAKKIVDVFVENFDFLSQEDGYYIMSILTEYMSGLYLSTNQTPLQKEAMKQCGFADHQKDFKTAMTEFIVLILHGYKELYPAKGSKAK